ncbi:MAG: alpha/beta fold hydrolase [Bacteroidales bacterium]|nr:alpha/beta fold hydrolase [Bacteroidales bacterium]
MKKTLILIAAALFLLPAVPANAGKIVTDSLRSAVLNSTVKYNVYLPDGYEKSSRKYPVVYLLHGLYGNYEDWRYRGLMKGIADELIACGEAVPMIIVMPNAGDADVHNVQNGYFNVKDWAYEDFFFGEFLPAVEEKYHAVGDKGHRAVMGLSMGGGGSTVYAQRHPDLFSSCYAMSAWMDNKTDAVKKPHAPQDKLDIVCESVCEHSTLDFVDAADAATLEKLRSVKWMVDCGDDDFLLLINEQFHQKMLQAGVPCEFRVRNGAHTWEYWHQALRLALPFASRNFDK